MLRLDAFGALVALLLFWPARAAASLVGQKVIVTHTGHQRHGEVGWVMMEEMSNVFKVRFKYGSPGLVSESSFEAHAPEGLEAARADFGQLLVGKDVRISDDSPVRSGEVGKVIAFDGTDIPFEIAFGDGEIRWFKYSVVSPAKKEYAMLLEAMMKLTLDFGESKPEQMALRVLATLVLETDEKLAEKLKDARLHFQETNDKLAGELKGARLELATHFQETDEKLAEKLKGARLHFQETNDKLAGELKGTRLELAMRWELAEQLKDARLHFVEINKKLAEELKSVRLHFQESNDKLAEQLKGARLESRAISAAFLLVFVFILLPRLHRPALPAEGRTAERAVVAAPQVDLEEFGRSLQTVADQAARQATKQGADRAALAALRDDLEELGRTVADQAAQQAMKQGADRAAAAALQVDVADQAMEQGVAMAAMRGRLDESATREAAVSKKMERLRRDLECMDEKAAFFIMYKMISQPKDLADLGRCMKLFATASARAAGASEASIATWIVLLQAMITVSTEVNMTDIQFSGAKLWTTPLSCILPDGSSAVTLYGSLTKAFREDNCELLLNGGIELMKGINSMVVNRFGHISRLLPDASWNRWTYRGTGIDKEALQFWRKLMREPQGDRKYRVPMPLASSLNRSVATDFLNEVPAAGPRARVLMRLHWLGGECKHAAYIDHVSDVPGEAEMLLASYSVVELVELDETVNPITMEIDVLADNRAHPECLPVTAWH